ncbi:hypothetical protein Pyn_16858 [Prunus yedoensis var. nudiflora]|uniref:Uncharacterized protein n=1 Tax=Prunus yedoensis var. nudiflora TaxID=2094558 RepID=A0A314YD92_PRUYE|nr:hypothetical protein Pyn_16858 [Prunus yedoensis var. nudiflora]
MLVQLNRSNSHKLKWAPSHSNTRGLLEWVVVWMVTSCHEAHLWTEKWKFRVAWEPRNSGQFLRPKNRGTHSTNPINSNTCTLEAAATTTSLAEERRWSFGCSDKRLGKEECRTGRTKQKLDFHGVVVHDF